MKKIFLFILLGFSIQSLQSSKTKYIVALDTKKNRAALLINTNKDDVLHIDTSNPDDGLHALISNEFLLQSKNTGDTVFSEDWKDAYTLVGYGEAKKVSVNEDSDDEDEDED